MSDNKKATPEEVAIPNPTSWYHAGAYDSDLWSGGFETREEAVADGADHHCGDAHCIAQAVLRVPSFAVFDGDGICERISDQDVWWEDGWQGEPDAAAKQELERRLEATLKQWFVDHASLDGAALNLLSTEDIPAKAVEARGEP